MSTDKSKFDLPRVLSAGATPPPAATSVLPAIHQPQQIRIAQPLTYLDVEVDGRESSYFEWLGAGHYCADRRNNTQNGQSHVLHELHYGFGERFFYVRVDMFPEWLAKLKDFEFRIMLRSSQEFRLTVLIEEGGLVGWLLDSADVCVLGPHELVDVAFKRILEIAIGRPLFTLAGQTSFALQVALWQCNLPVDFLPSQNCLKVKLGTDAFAWPPP